MRLSVVVLVVTACGGNGSNPPNSLLVGSDEDAGQFVVPLDGGGIEPLDAYFEQNQIHVTFATVSCAGSCALVQVVPTGGHPPYTVAWDNGSSSATRQVCPTATTAYRVKVTDTGSAGEIPMPPQTVDASLTTDVLASCPDASDTADADAASDCQTILTVEPPSSTLVGTGAESCTPLPSNLTAEFGAMTTLQAGQEYEITEDVTGMLILTGAPLWDLYGASSTCASPPGGQLLGSMTFDPSVPHQSICFRANADYSAIDWASSAVAAGYGQGVYKLCHGCSLGDAATEDASP